MNGRVEVSEREVKYEPRERQDQILRILNAMLKIFLLNAECDVFGRYSSGDVLQHRRVSGSGGWCQVGNRHLEDIKVHWLMRLATCGRAGVGGLISLKAREVWCEENRIEPYPQYDQRLGRC